MRATIWIAGLVIALSACTPPAESLTQDLRIHQGFAPQVSVGENNPEDAETLQNWIDETVSTLTSAQFETNLSRVAERYPQVWVSRARDAMPTADLRNVLHTDDTRFPALWWPETVIELRGDGTTDLARTGAKTDTTGEIEIGRLHYERFTDGDMVERSCAINTLAHEISHTLSDRDDAFWMHILDTEPRDDAPPNMYQASYLIGTLAQCTYLQDRGRIEDDAVFACLLTFSDPKSSSRFRSRACDDFPDDTPITPAGRHSL